MTDARDTIPLAGSSKGSPHGAAFVGSGTSGYLQDRRGRAVGDYPDELLPDPATRPGRADPVSDAVGSKVYMEKYRIGGVPRTPDVVLVPRDGAAALPELSPAWKAEQPFVFSRFYPEARLCVDYDEPGAVPMTKAEARLRMRACHAAGIAYLLVDEPAADFKAAVVAALSQLARVRDAGARAGSPAEIEMDRLDRGPDGK